jgi:fructokinase
MTQILGSPRTSRGEPSFYPNQLIAGVELGGTKCVCTLADAEGVICDQAVIPTTSPDETLSSIEAKVIAWSGEQALGGLGIASFGPVNLDRASSTYGFITATPKPGWRGTDVAQRLERSTGLSTAFDTDVNGAAMAEMLWGAGQGLQDFAYVTVGTGVGVGLIVNGKATRGLGHCELGHIRVARLAGDDWPGSCPYHGDCVEGLASGSALKTRLGDRAVADLANDDPVWSSVSWALAQMCQSIVCAAAPHRIVIGGGVMEAQPHLLPAIEAMLRDSVAGYVNIPDAEPYIQAPALGSRAGPLGPVALRLISA